MVQDVIARIKEAEDNAVLNECKVADECEQIVIDAQKNAETMKKEIIEKAYADAANEAESLKEEAEKKSEVILKAGNAQIEKETLKAEEKTRIAIEKVLKLITE